jgi:hypothetical protein
MYHNCWLLEFRLQAVARLLAPMRTETLAG